MSRGGIEIGVDLVIVRTGLLNEGSGKVSHATSVVVHTACAAVLATQDLEAASEQGKSVVTLTCNPESTEFSKEDEVDPRASFYFARLFRCELWPLCL